MEYRNVLSREYNPQKQGQFTNSKSMLLKHINSLTIFLYSRMGNVTPFVMKTSTSSPIGFICIAGAPSSPRFEIGSVTIVKISVLVYYF